MNYILLYFEYLYDKISITQFRNHQVYTQIMIYITLRTRSLFLPLSKPKLICFIYFDGKPRKPVFEKDKCSEIRFQSY